MSHDYDPSTDYEVIEEPDPSTLLGQDLQEAKARAESRLCEAMNLGGITFFFVDRDGLGEGRLACFCDGTSSAPVIGLDLEAIERAAEMNDWSIQEEIEACVAHELGHAYLETLGLYDQTEIEGVEEAIEDFARAYAEDGVIKKEILENFAAPHLSEGDAP